MTEQQSEVGTFSRILASQLRWQPTAKTAVYSHAAPDHSKRLRPVQIGAVAHQNPAGLNQGYRGVKA